MSGLRDVQRGLLMTALTFVLWGVVPLYWKLLKHVPPLQIIAHRIVWCTLFVLGWLFLSVRFAWWHAIKATPGARLMLLGSGVAIALDWGLYIWAINTDHVIESSLGYFISPLLSVLLGVLLLQERLRGLQWLAVVCAALGVAWLTWQAGKPPWIALGLALSLSLYGLLRKVVAVDAVAGLCVESLYLFLPALALLLWGEAGHGGGFFSGWSVGTDVLLVFGGVVTALPLICFSYGVRLIPLSLLGLLQYIGPTLGLALGVWFFHEPFDAYKLLGFVVIWIGLLLFIGDTLWQVRRTMG